MSQILTLELSEQVFAAIQLQARAMGISPERLAAVLLERQSSQVKLPVDEAEGNAARQRFECHFGTLNNVNDSTDLDNEGIDTDLVEPYISTYEQE